MSEGITDQKPLTGLDLGNIYQTMFENTGTAMMIIDEDDLIILVNTECEKLSGYDKASLEGRKRWTEFVSAADLERLQLARKRRKMRMGKRGKYELGLINRDGFIKTVLSTISEIPGTEKIVVSLIDISEQKKSELALRESEEKYRSYLNESPDGVFIADSSGKYLEVNPAGARMLGYSEQEILQMSVTDITDSYGLGRFKHLLLAGQSMGEAALIRKDGTLLDAEINAVSIGNNLYQAIVRDITKQKQAEAALRRSEELYRMIFENSPLGICHFDCNGMITHCNNRLTEIVNAPKEKIIGLRMMEDLKDDAMKEAIGAALKGQVGCFEGNYLSVAGAKWVPLRATFSTIRGDGGTFLGAIGVYEDISERTKTESALRRSETYNSLILNGITEAVALYEVVDGFRLRFVRANNNLLNLLGLKEEEVLGNFLEDVFPVEWAKRCLKNTRRAVKNKEPLFYEESFDEIENYHVRLYPVLDEEGRCTHLIGLTNNITEQKRIEEHELKIAKLESVGLLAGGIAHDFNNILTAILGNASLAKMKINSASLDKEKMLDWIAEIERASHQAKELTQQLLTFAKGGKPILKVISIGDLLKETADFALRGTNVCCEYKISSNVWPVEVDEGQMSQVIHNLVINANHAMPEGGVIIISAENVSAGKRDTVPYKKGNYVKITVQDQGCGIPAEFINKIFDPYFTTKQMGSGLGLTTTYAVVRKHLGYITLESEVGVGTTFYIYLPAAKGPVTGRIAGVQTTIIGKGKVLVMDDELIIRQVLGEMLEVLGYDVVCVKDGTEAIESYQEAMTSSVPFDLVIMDLTIPGGLGGKETIKELLRLDPKVRAIVSSGYSNDPVMADYKKYGFLDVVSKPYNVDELAEVLEKLTNQSYKHRRVK